MISLSHAKSVLLTQINEYSFDAQFFLISSSLISVHTPTLIIRMTDAGEQLVLVSLPSFLLALLGIFSPCRVSQLLPHITSSLLFTPMTNSISGFRDGASPTCPLPFVLDHSFSLATSCRNILLHRCICRLLNCVAPSPPHEVAAASLSSP